MAADPESDFELSILPEGVTHIAYFEKRLVDVVSWTDAEADSFSIYDESSPEDEDDDEGLEDDEEPTDEEEPVISFAGRSKRIALSGDHFETPVLELRTEESELSLGMFLKLFAVRLKELVAECKEARKAFVQFEDFTANELQYDGEQSVWFVEVSANAHVIHRRKGKRMPGAKIDDGSWAKFQEELGV